MKVAHAYLKCRFNRTSSDWLLPLPQNYKQNGYIGTLKVMKHRNQSGGE